MEIKRGYKKKLMIKKPRWEAFYYYLHFYKYLPNSSHSKSLKKCTDWVIRAEITKPTRSHYFLFPWCEKQNINISKQTLLMLCFFKSYLPFRNTQTKWCMLPWYLSLCTDLEINTIFFMNVMMMIIIIVILCQF